MTRFKKKRWGGVKIAVLATDLWGIIPRRLAETDFGRTEPNREFSANKKTEPRLCREWRRLAEPNRDLGSVRFGSVRQNAWFG